MPRSSLLCAGLLTVFFLAVYLLVGSSDLQHNGDTDLRYQTTQAIVDHHRLWIDRPMWNDTRVARGVGGHLYAFYAPGQAVFMIPLYLAGKFVAHHLSLPYDVTTLYATRSLDLLLGAALAVVFFFMAQSIGYSMRTSALLTLLFGLATPALPDAQSALEQTQVDLFLLLAVWGVWLFVRDSRSRIPLALSGCAAGLGLFTRYDFALFLPLLALYPAVMQLKRGRRGSIIGDWAAFGLGLLPWAVAVLLWNAARFGSPFLTGLHERTLGEPFLSGFLGLTVSPGKGLLWYCPLIFLLPACVPPLYRRHPSLTIFMAAVVVVPLLFYSNVVYWHGDPAWGPRYLYTSIPYLVLPLGEIFERWRLRSRPFTLLALSLVGLSLVIQASAVSVTQWRFWYRLEAMEEHTAQKFRWGGAYYHYYWNAGQSPILLQIDDVYQVVRLDAFGVRRYRFVARPTALTPTRQLSNPADNYPINTLAFWWADTRHPLLGARTRAGIASLLAGAAALSLLLLLAQLRRNRAPESRGRELYVSPAEAVGG